MSLNNGKRLWIILGLSIAIIGTMIISLLSNTNINGLNSQKNDIDLNGLSTSESEIDVIDFWESELPRLEKVALDLELSSEKQDLEYTNLNTKQSFLFKKQEINFTSSNWVGATPSTLKLHGYLLYPEEYNPTGNPGCLCMHGLNGLAEDAFSLAYSYLEKGFIVLTHDHPGHGDSEGAQPEPDNFYYEGNYNEKAHPYLTICGAIQGLRILESLPEVDNSKIMVTGASYGGLNTMWLSSICGDRIAGALPYIATGDLDNSLKDPSLLIFWLWGKSAEEIQKDDDFWNEETKYFDPKYYIQNTDNLPPILWQVGTTDEYFHYHGITGTFEAVKHENAFLQVFPNGHHGFIGYEDTTKFWIDYIINDGDLPPTIQKIDEISSNDLILGDVRHFEVEVDSSASIKSVEICYRYIDIIGSRWERKNMIKTGEGTWTGVLSSGMFNSKVDYYFIVTLEGSSDVWFTSEIFQGGMFNSNISFLMYIFLIAYIAMPATIFIWRRYKKNVKELEENNNIARKYMILEISILIVAESLFFVSLILPWAVFESGGVVWTHLYVFNRFYTFDTIFLFFAPFMTAAFLLGWIFYANLSTMKPIISGSLQILYPLGVFGIFSILTGVVFSADPSNSTSNFGLVFPGAGIYLMFFSSLTVLIVGIWKRQYQAKLGIRVPKTKWYNIDRWFRIKPKSDNKLDESNGKA